MQKPKGSINDDHIHDTLVAKGSASMPYAHREMHGSTEFLFVSSRAMELVHEVLSVALVLKGGLDLIRSEVATLLRSDIQRHVSLSAVAIQLLEGDVGPLNAMVLVNICAALESGIEDTIRAAIRFQPHLVQHLKILGVEKINAPADRDLTYREACAVFRRLKVWAADERVAPAGWLKMLNAIGISIDLDEGCRQAIREMIYLRNCILHRGGRVDDRYEVEVSSLELEAGRQFNVPNQAMGTYVRAAQLLAEVIVKTVTTNTLQSLAKPLPPNA